MEARWFNWFLNEEEGSSRYKEFYADVQRDLAKFTWYALLGFVVDIRLWPEAKNYQAIMTPYSSSWSEEKAILKDHFQELTGKVRTIQHSQNGDTFAFVEDDTQTTLFIPLKAIISYRSTGFPKVAHSSERYLLGYLSWLDYYEGIIYHHPQVITPNWLTLRIENFHPDVFACLQALRTWELSHRSNQTEGQALYEKLLKTMIATMENEVPLRCKPPYHHVLEWQIDVKILKRDHPLIAAYLDLRKQYPAMVVLRLKDINN